MSEINFGLAVDPFPEAERVKSFRFIYKNLTPEEEYFVVNEFWKFKREVDVKLLDLKANR